MNPVGPDAIYRALAALGAAPVMDPELWPNGPQDDDRARLLGCLLAKTELELAATTRTSAGENGLAVLGDVYMGWMDEVGPDRDTALAVLVSRLERTAVHLLDPEDPDAENAPPGQFTAWAAVVTAVTALGAHMHAQDGDVEGVRRALGRVESCIIQLLQGVHDLRVVIGDADDDEDESED
ncbi:hypothetical protein GCM10010425_49310 [Streptomyces spororaveus]|uniref:Uncharacterized protein n=1 Tax=Streptomyces spororaveus TaxID=284039 RepID=A0ABQ3T2A7_9ACTN|nr:hypothetical protein Sspor_00860 [Streptomyces spororaveus]